jgi:hypothetical protein
MSSSFQINSDDLDGSLLEKIKSEFPNQEIIIDVYSTEKIDIGINEITNEEILRRINDIKDLKNLIFPKIDLDL